MHATILHHTYLAHIVISKASGMLECTMITISTEVLCSTHRNVHSQEVSRRIPVVLFYGHNP